MKYYAVYKEIRDLPNGRIRLRVFMGTFRKDAIVQLSEALDCSHRIARRLLAGRGGEVALSELPHPFPKRVTAYSRLVEVPTHLHGRPVIYCAFDTI